MTGDCHVRFPEGVGVKFPRATRLENGVSTLIRYENLANGESLADHVENLQFGYLDADGTPPATPAEIRLVRVSLTARTSQSDADLPGDGYRRRQIASNIHLRNMGLEP